MRLRAAFFILPFLLVSCTSAADPEETLLPASTKFYTPYTAAASTAAPSASPSPTAKPSSTASPYPATVSPMPTLEPDQYITPLPSEAERWQEYQTVFAGRLLSFHPVEEVLCEWLLLGRADQELYAWAYCATTVTIGDTGHYSGSSVPVVIKLGPDGSVLSVDIPGSGSAYSRDIRKMFPADVQEMVFSHQDFIRRLTEHLDWRRSEAPDEPPLVVLDVLED